MPAKTTLETTVLRRLKAPSALGNVLHKARVRAQVDAAIAAALAAAHDGETHIEVVVAAAQRGLPRIVAGLADEYLIRALYRATSLAVAETYQAIAGASDADRAAWWTAMDIRTMDSLTGETDDHSQSGSTSPVVA